MKKGTGITEIIWQEANSLPVDCIAPQQYIQLNMQILCMQNVWNKAIEKYQIISVHLTFSMISPSKV